MPSREFATPKCNEPPPVEEKSKLSKEDEAEVARLRKLIEGEFSGRFLCRLSVNVHVCRPSQRECRVVMASEIRVQGGRNRRQEDRFGLRRERGGAIPQRSGCAGRSDRIQKTLGARVRVDKSSRRGHCTVDSVATTSRDFGKASSYGRLRGYNEGTVREGELVW